MKKKAKGFYTVIIDSVKEPDIWQEMFDELGLDEDARETFLEFGEYASLEIQFDASLNIVGGRMLPNSGDLE